MKFDALVDDGRTSFPELWHWMSTNIGFDTFIDSHETFNRKQHKILVFTLQCFSKDEHRSSESALSILFRYLFSAFCLIMDEFTLICDSQVLISSEGLSSSHLRMQWIICFLMVTYLSDSRCD